MNIKDYNPKDVLVSTDQVTWEIGQFFFVFEADDGLHIECAVDGIPQAERLEDGLLELSKATLSASSCVRLVQNGGVMDVLNEAMLTVRRRVADADLGVDDDILDFLTTDPEVLAVTRLVEKRLRVWE